MFEQNGSTSSENFNLEPINVDQLTNSIREGNTHIHQLIIAKKESLNKKAKKLRALSRSRWYAMMLYIRKRILVRESTVYQNKKNARLDVYANVAVQNIVRAIKFKASEKVFNETTRLMFDPIKWYKVPYEVPTVEELSNEASNTFIEFFDFNVSTSKIVPGVYETLPMLENYYCTRDRSSNDDQLNQLAGDVVATADFGPTITNYETIIYPFLSFSQDTMIMQRAKDPNLLISTISLAAVQPFCFHQVFPIVAKESRGTFRKLLRMAYPRWDNEDPLELDRPLTLDEYPFDEDVEAAMKRIRENKAAIDRKARRKTIKEIMERAGIENSSNLENYSNRSRRAEDQLSDSFNRFSLVGLYPPSDKQVYYYDLSSILSGFDTKLLRLISPIPKIIAETQYYSSQTMWQEFSLSIFDVAKQISHDTRQHIPEESLSFVQRDIDKSLVEFVGGAIGVSDVVDEFLEFGIESASNLASVAVSNLAFGNLRTLVPFLDGLSKIKRHKKEDGMLVAGYNS